MNGHVFVWGLNSLLQASVVSALALLVAACLRRNPAARYWVLHAALMLLLLCPVFALVMQGVGGTLLSVEMLRDGAVAPRRSTAAAARADELTVGLPPATSPHDSYLLDGIRDSSQMDATALPAATAQETDAAPPPAITPDSYPLRAGFPSGGSSKENPKPPLPAPPGPVHARLLGSIMRPLLGVWLAGMVTLIARMGVSSWRLGRILRSADRNTNRSLADAFEQAGRALQLRSLPELVLSDRVWGPMSAGLIRPRVVLPTRMAEQASHGKVRDVLVHELAHVVRRDPVTVLLQNIAGAVFWPHPLVLWLNRALARAREDVCDNYVLATTNASAYSRTLLTLAQLAQRRAMPGTVGLFTSNWKLEHRVAGLLDERRNCAVRLTNRTKLLVAGLSLAMATLAGLGTVTLAVAEDAESPSAQQSAPVDPARVADALAEAQTRRAVTMRGGGADREMLLRGRVFDSDGQPAREYELRAIVKRSPAGREALTPKIDGSRFELWVPIGGSDWFYVTLSATTRDGKQRAFRSISNFSLRQAALDGVVLTLMKPSRTVQVSVTKDATAVANAHVTAQLTDLALLHRDTADDGVATFRLMDDEKLQQLTAWTDDFELGGYMFSRKPRHDGLGNEFTIELSDCRDQTIRLLDAEDDSPIPGVAFVLTVGTGPPNYNYPGGPDTLPQPRMTTNHDGEAVYRWFPDWEQHGSYLDVISRQWFNAAPGEMTQSDDGALVVRLNRRKMQRKPLTGRVTSKGLNVGGLLVMMTSRQGENHGDRIYAMTTSDGRFTADCFPGTTYCVYVMDERYVSKTIDLIPYEPDTGKPNTATLELEEGAPVEIRLTAGPNHWPMRNQFVHLETPYYYEYRENGKKRVNPTGKRWFARTDRYGIAHARARAGTELVASVNAGDWRSGEVKTTVKPDGVTKLAFHREVVAERVVTGRLIPPPKIEVDVARAEVVFGPIDGETDDRHTVKADEWGHFAFRTKAGHFGIFAYTADGKAAGIARSRDAERPINVQLKPTVDLRGRLLGADDKPLVGHAVRVAPRVGANEHYVGKRFRTSFATRTFETRTDGKGNYTLEDLPAELPMRLRADPIDDSGQDPFLNEFYLRVGDERPRLVSRLGRSRARAARSLAQRFDSVLRDAALGDFHAMVLIFDPTGRDFVNASMLDHSQTEEVMNFLHLPITNEDLSEKAGAELIKTRNWPTPKPHVVFACALDGAGNELGRIELDLTTNGVEEDAAKFIRRHSPATSDAKLKWAAAFAEAKRSNRKVWARISQRYCGPCFLLTRWLDDHRELLKRDYVLLKIDDVRDKHGKEVAKRIVSGPGPILRYGVPFHAIFDADEERLIDSEGPIGNVGHPSSYEGRRHVTKMLRDTSLHLSPEQIERIVATLE